MSSLSKQWILNLLLILFAILATRKFLHIWKYAKKTKRACIAHAASSNIEEKERQSAQIFQALFNSVDIHLEQLIEQASLQRPELQVILFEKINILIKELTDIKRVYHKESSPAFFLLGPLAAPAQAVKERALKKRILDVEQSIEALLSQCL